LFACPTRTLTISRPSGGICRFFEGCPERSISWIEMTCIFGNHILYISTAKSLVLGNAIAMIIRINVLGDKNYEGAALDTALGCTLPFINTIIAQKMYTTLTNPIVVDIDTRGIRRSSLCLAPLLHLLRGPHSIYRLYKRLKSTTKGYREGMKERSCGMEKHFQSICLGLAF
jgi:hypothetical protein